MTASATRVTPSAEASHAPPTTIAHWIGGEPFQGDSERWGPVYNPATGAIDVGNRGEANPPGRRAVAVAKEVSVAWGRSALGKRATILFKFRELVAQHVEELARCIVREHGKVLSLIHISEPTRLLS